jgi:hypothetical protein
MASSSVQMSVVCDSSPFVLFTKLLESHLKISERSLDIVDLGFELFRIESDLGSASTGKLVVRLYPSDSFLRFAATVFAGDFNLAIVE